MGLGNTSRSGGMIDDIAFIKSVYCKNNNHAPAMFEMNSGMIQVGYPSTGSWLIWLGGNQDLPGFIVMYDHRGGPIGDPQNWGSVFLPQPIRAHLFVPPAPRFSICSAQMDTHRKCSAIKHGFNEATERIPPRTVSS